jgi:hypothetical protein
MVIVVPAVLVGVVLVELDDDELPQPASAITTRASAVRAAGLGKPMTSVVLTRSHSRGPGLGG